MERKEETDRRRRISWVRLCVLRMYRIKILAFLKLIKERIVVNKNNNILFFYLRMGKTTSWRS